VKVLNVYGFGSRITLIQNIFFNGLDEKPRFIPQSNIHFRSRRVDFHLRFVKEYSGLLIVGLQGLHLVKQCVHMGNDGINRSLKTHRTHKPFWAHIPARQNF
jgi:hypothetical protein